MLINPSLEYTHISEWASTLVNLQLTPKSLARRLSTHLNTRHPVRVKLHYTDTQLDFDDFTVGAEYDPELDESGKKQFIINLIFNHPEDQPLLITQDFASTLAIDLVEALVHEYQHQHQYRSRRYLANRGYTSQHKDVKIKEDQEYLGQPDEIDAYAVNIAVRFYILKDKLNSSKPVVSLDLKQYYMIFGPNHPVIKRLLKKIIINTYYLKDSNHD